MFFKTFTAAEINHLFHTAFELFYMELSKYWNKINDTIEADK